VELTATFYRTRSGFQRVRHKQEPEDDRRTPADNGILGGDQNRGHDQSDDPKEHCSHNGDLAKYPSCPRVARTTSARVPKVWGVARSVASTDVLRVPRHTY
jgi:hypothetical protein